MALKLVGPLSPEQKKIVSPEALAFLEKLVTKFSARRLELLKRREEVQRRIDDGIFPDFLPETKNVREGSWKVAPIPAALLDRRVEITGPVDRKMVINALNSGANMFMADFEDSHSPTWDGTLAGQQNMFDAVRRQISFKSPEGKEYQLNEKTATLLVRPRGWHLVEKNVLLDGEPISGSLFDFALFFFHNAKEQLARGAGPYFYLPKLESHLEARLWNDVFNEAQDLLGVKRGSIKATVLIETILAAFEMDEIIYELKDHMAGLNCGRWDYIFSYIKKFRNHPSFVVGDRAQVTMTQHFLKSYCELLVQTCHKRGAFAMGGMAAQIPIKNDPAANDAAIAKVTADKTREVSQGFDGTWVAHPGLVPVAKKVFDDALKGPNQLSVLREEVRVTAKDLLKVPEAAITENGIRMNINVGVQYLEAWLRGQGCVPLHNLMEDAATAEISRAQLWQWIKNGKLATGDFRAYLADELAKIRKQLGEKAFAQGRFELAAQLFDEFITSSSFQEFLTLRGYQYLDQRESTTMSKEQAISEIESAWKNDKRWKGIRRSFTAADVYRLRGSVKIEYTLARNGAARFWDLLHTEDFIPALGALTGNMALQQVEAGLKAIYLSGWQVAADANLAGHMYPDQSLYPIDSVPNVVKRINQAFARADQIQHAEGKPGPNWFAPIVADAEAGFGGNLNAYELMKMMIEAGAAAVHWEDQLASAKKCGHMGGKVLVSTSEAVQKLNAARLAADVMGVPTVIVARTDANGAHLITTDIDPRDKKFITGERTSEGFFKMKGGLDAAIARGLAYAPYADVVWCETAHPDVDEARKFAKAIHDEFPGKLLAYNCSPSFNWKKNLDDKTIASFQKELGKMGYKFQFVTLAGFHALNYSMFELAHKYKDEGMAAYSRFQETEFASEKQGYRATAHQRFVGTGYFDQVATAIAGGELSTAALKGSTEEEQFDDHGAPGKKH
ncbi:MAG: malate synthase A [Deltaproteobacteria bacterium]|nr:malate synthase A [Deltaproteobacteria bacterium]